MATEVDNIVAVMRFESEQAEKRARSFERRMESVERRFDPLARATQKYNRDLKTVERAYESGIIDAGRYEAAIANLNSEFEGNAVATGKTIGQSRNMSAVMQQVGFQVGDFATQVGGGTSALTAFGQQASQLLGVFGAYGAVAGASVAVAAPLIRSFLETSNQAESYSDALEDLQEAVAAYSQAAMAASDADLDQQFGLQADNVRAFLVLLSGMSQNTALTELEASAKALSEEFGGTFEALNTVGRGFANARDDARILAEGFGLTVESAIELDRAIGAIGKAEGPREVIDAATELNALFGRLFDTTADIPEQFAEVARAAAQVGIEAATIEKTTDDARVTAIEMADAFYSAARGLAANVPEADVLLGQIESIAKAAWDYAGAMGEARRERALAGPDQARFENMDTFLPNGIRRDDVVVSRTFDSGRRQAASRRKSGGSRRSQKPKAVEFGQQIQRLERELELVGKSTVQIAELETKWRLLDEAKQKNIAITNELTARIDAEASKVGVLASEYEKATNKAEAMTSINQTLKDSIIDAGMGGADAFDQLKESIKRAALEYALFGQGPIAGATGGGFGGLLGGLFSFPSFDGGGYTGSGSRSGGLDGRGGFPALLHPNETIIDHTKGQSMAAPEIVVRSEPGVVVEIANAEASRLVRQSAPMIAQSGARQAQQAFGTTNQEFQKRGTS